MAGQEFTTLCEGMIGIIVDSGERVGKRRSGLLERHAVFPHIQAGLPRIPRELHLRSLRQPRCALHLSATRMTRSASLSGLNLRIADFRCSHALSQGGTLDTHACLASEQRPSRKGAQLTARNLMLRRRLLQGSSPELCLEGGFQSFSTQGEAIPPTDDARLL